MSTFDNPFDPKRRLNRSGCGCRQHRSQAEHDAEAQRQLHCASIESEQARYEGVVASAVMRAVFPRESARRAFLKAVGASTALAALSSTVFTRPPKTGDCARVAIFTPGGRASIP